MKGDFHVRFRENLRVKLPWVTRLAFMRVDSSNEIWSISKKYIPLSKGNTMKNLSLKLEDDIFQETEKIVTKVKKNRNRYINEAIEFYNRLHRRRLLSKQLNKESKIVAKDSLEVLAEFEKLSDED